MCDEAAWLDAMTEFVLGENIGNAHEEVFFDPFEEGAEFAQPEIVDDLI